MVLPWLYVKKKKKKDKTKQTNKKYFWFQAKNVFRDLKCLFLLFI